jgi:hypothetical protein
MGRIVRPGLKKGGNFYTFGSGATLIWKYHEKSQTGVFWESVREFGTIDH